VGPFGDEIDATNAHVTRNANPVGKIHPQLDRKPLGGASIGPIHTPVPGPIGPFGDALCLPPTFDQ
jgi:hypothetical protein